SGRVLDANDEFLRIVGYSREDLEAGKLNWKHLTAPEWLELSHEAVGQVQASGNAPVFEKEYLRKDGTRVPVLIGVAAVRNPQPHTIAFVVDLTLRKRAQAERDRLMVERIAMLDSVGDGIFGLDTSGRCTFINRAGSTILGYAQEECLGRNMHELIHSRRADCSPYPDRECPIFGAFRTGTGVCVDSEVLWRKDGSALPVEYSSYPIVLDGRIEGSVVSIKDISERKQSEARLRASEERFHSAFAHAAAGVFITDLEGVFLEVNRAFCQMLGCDEAELLGTPYQNVAHADDLERDRQVLGRLLRQEIPGFVGQERFVRKNGEFLRARISVSVAKDASGRPTHVVCLIEDVTEQLRAESELRLSEQRYRSIVENTHEGICMCDADRRVTYSNARLCAMLGYAEGACLECSQIHLESDAENTAGRFERRKQGVSEYFETRLRRRDGSPVWVSTSASPLRDDTGNFSGSLCLFADMTERKKLEGQLLQSQKMEAIGRLAGGIAHDFNNLLTVILGYSSILERKLAAQDPLTNNVVEIRKAGERAAALTQKLLTFSRKQVQSPRIFSVNHLIRDTESMLQRLLGEQIRLVTSLDPAAGNIQGDTGQMEQVLMNLAINSRDAMPNGGQLLIETERQELDRNAAQGHGLQPGPYVLLSVTDTGCGMDEQTKSKIFEPFFTTKDPGIGTGLGLSTVLGIVNQSGGAISVYSEIHVGTTFKIYLPLVSGPVTVLELARHPAGLAHGENILLVEDDSRIRVLAASVLREHGYTVLEAASAEAALAHGAALSSVDLLLTDIVMSGMNGRQLAEKLVAAHPQIRVLYMSGYTENAVTQQGVLDPGLNFLPKPFRPDDLLIKTAEVLARVDRRGNILVVDDDSQVRSFLATLLETDGYTVIQASDGKQAQSRCQETVFDLVIMDLVMPEQEGLETIHALRKQSPELPVVAISGAFAGAYLELARKLGAKAVFRKPFEPSSVLREIHRLIQR
ncbi:MAG TPA: PAS domain S-box protein, partial [Bryobacteraceae bacterium]|nr:PAS domain S-box protein [Bryobacteraceae bacterium]